MFLRFMDNFKMYLCLKRATEFRKSYQDKFYKLSRYLHLEKHVVMDILTSFYLLTCVIYQCGQPCRLADLAARSSARASGPVLATRASCTRTMASIRCSSRGISDVASKGMMLPVRDSDSCRQKSQRATSNVCFSTVKASSAN